MVKSTKLLAVRSFGAFFIRVATSAV